MKKQLNLFIDEEDHAILVKEVGKRMNETGKYLSLVSVAYDLLKPEIARLNGQTPSEDNIQDSKQDDKQDSSQIASAFDKIDF